MKIVLTGALGFLGSHLWQRLLEHGHEVVSIDNMIGGDHENAPAGKACQWVADCCTLEKMTIACYGADVVYHLAASPHEGLSVFSPTFVTQHTYMSSVAMATAAIKCGVKRFVFCSSMARYGENHLPFTEGMTPLPVDPYGIAKVASEQAIRVLAKEHGMEYVILVPHNIVGERQRYWDPYRNVVAIMANLMLQGKSPIIYGDGTQKRCFTYVGDVIDCFVTAGLQSGLDGEVINIGPDENPVTIAELADELATIIGFDGKFRYMPARPCEVKYAYCSANKARKQLGYQTKTSLHEMLVKIVEWIKAKGPRPFEYHLPIEILTERTPKTWAEKLF